MRALWIFLFGVLVADSAVAGSPPQPNVLRSAHSYNFPNGGGQNSFLLNGMATPSNSGYVLNSAQNGMIGSMWHPLQMGSPPYTVEIDFSIAGNSLSANTTADGFAVWIVDDTNLIELVQPKTDPHEWGLISYKPNFVGFSSFFSTTARDDNVRHSVSASFSNGTQTLSSVKDIPTRDGVYWNWGTTGSPDETRTIYLKIVVDERGTTGQVRKDQAKEWTHAFNISGASPPVFGYLGITASNRRPTKNFNNSRAEGLAVNVTRIHVRTSDAGMTYRPHRAGKPEEIMNLHILPLQEMLIRQLISVQNVNKLMSKRLEIIENSLNKSGDKQLIQTALEGIRRDITSSAESYGLMSNLESSVRTATSTTKWIAIVLGSLFVLFGISMFKRMRDMEKKHFL